MTTRFNPKTSKKVHYVKQLYRTSINLKLKKTLYLTQFRTRYRAENYEVQSRKVARLKTPQSEILKTTFVNSRLMQELIIIKAFVGDFYRKTHRSQESLTHGYKNKYSFYSIIQVIKLFSSACFFIKKVILNKSFKLVFVGCPSKAEKSCVLLFRNLKIPFFPNEAWRPGFFSIKKFKSNTILIVYNPNLNSMAFYEAVNKNIPVVGFTTPQCNLHGLDYPVILNLENSGLWYSRFWKTLLNTN